jgi:hypothetical protein
MTRLERAEITQQEFKFQLETHIAAWRSGKKEYQSITNGLSEPDALAAIKNMVRKSLEDPVYVNDTYQVHVHDSGGIVHLSIRRLDREPIRDWRDFQEIKNQLVGPECEGVELYPAESRVVDMANQYHLWVFKDPENKVPLGFNSGRQVSNEAVGRGRQRPR